MAKRRYRFHDMPIRQKLLMITLLVALLICGVSLGGFQLVTRSYNQMIYTQTASSLAVVADKVAARLDSLMEVSLYIAVNREFQKNLYTINEQPFTSAHGLARSEISSQLYSTFHSDLISVSVYPLEANPIVIGATSSQESAGVRARAKALAAEAKGAPSWLPTGREDGSVLCVREIRNVSKPFLQTMGLLLLRVDLGKIVREAAGDILSGEYDIAISQHEELLYPYAANGKGIFDQSVFDGGLPYAVSGNGGEARFVTRSPIRAFRLRWDLVLGIPYGDVFRSLMIANVSFGAGIAAAVVLAMPFSRRMLSSINRNVQLLANKMNRVQKGDLTPYPGEAPLGEDELGVLNRHFDKMTADFKQVIDDSYVKELLLAQTQLKALEQQINPHFLYNSLDSINWFARRGEGRNVSAIAQSLGSLLRSTLSEDEDCIPLRQELDILDSYLRIQGIRFPDTLRVDIQADGKAMDALVPKMSIQPLVENAIVHSLEENIGECRIQVRAALEGGMLLVEVENDGSEIDVNILDKLREKTARPKGHGIGLINIDSRVKLLFGQEYGLELKSLEDRVTVSFRIPAMAGTGLKGE